MAAKKKNRVVRARQAKPKTKTADKASPETTESAVVFRRLVSIRGINESVEQFHIFAKTCISADELVDAFERYRDCILAALRLRRADGEKLDADILLIDSQWKLKLSCATEHSYWRYVPDLQLRHTGNGNLAEPSAQEGVATYAVWANSNRRPGVAIARDVPKTTAIQYYEEVFDRDHRGASWYKPKPVPNMYMACPSGTPPYRSILSAPVMLMQEAHADPLKEPKCECIGILNITHSSAKAFGPEDCAWAQTCASLVGSIHQSFFVRYHELCARDGVTVTGHSNEILLNRPRKSDPAAAAERLPRSIAAIGAPAIPVSGANAVTASPAAVVSSEQKQRFEHVRVEPWESVREDIFARDVTTFGPAEQKWVLGRLERIGFCLVRYQGTQPSIQRLLSLEGWLGAARERQNDHVGKIKEINPQEAIAANTGDSAKDLPPHVDGTQDPITPAVLVFEYLTTPTFGGISSFTDMNQVLFEFPEDERERILIALARKDAAVCEKKGLRYEGPLVRTCASGGVSFRLRFDDVIKVHEDCINEFNLLRDRVLAKRRRVEYSPREGDIVIFDNWRLLHARQSVEATRHLRFHNRMWIDDVLERHRGDCHLGVRGLGHDVLARVERANAGST